MFPSAIRADQAVAALAGACEGALARAFGFPGKRWNGVLLAALALLPALDELATWAEQNLSQTADADQRAGRARS